MGNDKPSSEFKQFYHKITELVYCNFDSTVNGSRYGEKYNNRWSCKWRSWLYSTIECNNNEEFYIIHNAKKNTSTYWICLQASWIFKVFFGWVFTDLILLKWNSHYFIRFVILFIQKRGQVNFVFFDIDKSKKKKFR